ncbi:3-dehydroquinate synthase [Flavobacteriaceae bacterium]|nr:3-dehydroquinate synthase [Flavobacteriaceae bacterium]|tara:strand:- start:969 stop:2027 length:1059 start_codon:yes stop_codon:yes gene_type:complete
MKEIKAKNYSIFFGINGYDKLLEYIKVNNYSKIFIHLDSNTNKLCLNVFLKQFKEIDFEKLVSRPGEENKNIESCLLLWNNLSEHSGDRKSLIINLGGGVVGDMGGFIASTFKRGIDYVNIPTTLLSMVDASVGGKTGVNLDVLKNQVGTFYDPKMVIIDPLYLNTLEYSEILSGYAEIFKHSIISDLIFFDKLNSYNENLDFKNIDLIKASIEIKNRIVLLDPKEENERKALNFGHTLGHSIESFFLKSKNRLLHGEAIAIGMILASYISHKSLGFSIKDVEKIKQHILKIYKKISFTNNNVQDIINLLVHDKKNSHGKINFVLIKKIGKPVYDIEVRNETIIDAFNYYSY